MNVRLGDRTRSLDVHPCALAPECRVTVRLDILMCGPHWRMVPKTIRRDTYGAYQRFRRTGLLTDYDLLRKAQARATEAVREKLRGKGKRV